MTKAFPDFLERRMPARNEIFLASSMATFLVFSWSLRMMFYTFPSFSLSHRFGEIFIIVTYMMTFALLDTLFATLALVVLAVILPGAVLKDGFSYKASFFFIASTVIFIHLQYTLTNQTKIGSLILELGLILVLWLVPVLLTRYVDAVRKIVLDILDRLTIFSYVYIPLGVISLFVVIIRLLW